MIKTLKYATFKIFHKVLFSYLLIDENLIFYIMALLYTNIVPNNKYKYISFKNLLGLNVPMISDHIYVQLKVNIRIIFTCVEA